MPSLEYSDNAINTINLFHRVDVMAYVEGDDDVTFWEYILGEFSDLSFKVQEVGGKPELQKYIDGVFNGKLSCVVAMDSDYSVFGENYMHENILITPGYSIENTLISAETIRDMVRSLGSISKREIPLDDCAVWLNEFEEKVEPLVLHDIENHIRNLGVSVVGDNCDRFFENKSSFRVCDQKVSLYLEGIGFQLSNEKETEIKRVLVENNVEIKEIVRGHFIFSAVWRFVSTMIRKIRSKISISKQALFGALLLAFERIFDDSHPHYNHYQNVVVGINIATE